MHPLAQAASDRLLGGAVDLATLASASLADVCQLVSCCSVNKTAETVRAELESWFAEGAQQMRSWIPIGSYMLPAPAKTRQSWGWMSSVCISRSMAALEALGISWCLFEPCWMCWILLNGWSTTGFGWAGYGWVEIDGV